MHVAHIGTGATSVSGCVPYIATVALAPLTPRSLVPRDVREVELCDCAGTLKSLLALPVITFPAACGMIRELPHMHMCHMHVLHACPTANASVLQDRDQNTRVREFAGHEHTRAARFLNTLLAVVSCCEHVM